MGLKGYKQTPEHIERKKRFGEAHHAWLGDKVSKKSGRCRTLRAVPDAGCCSKCGGSPAERHHKDENTANNNLDNIEILCRKCHMKIDGRLEKFREMTRANQPMANRIRWSNREISPLPLTVETIVSAYLSNISIKEIAATCECGVKRITKELLNAGVRLRSKSENAFIQREKWTS